MVILFFLAVAIVVLLVWAETASVEAMPFSCPSCHFGGDRDLAGQPDVWYRRAGQGRARCRHCGTYFKDHPDGSLVEDRDG